MIIETIDEGRV